VIVVNKGVKIVIKIKDVLNKYDKWFWIFFKTMWLVAFYFIYISAIINISKIVSDGNNEIRWVYDVTGSAIGGITYIIAKEMSERMV
jgi:hypothetical protein